MLQFVQYFVVLGCVFGLATLGFVDLIDYVSRKINRSACSSRRSKV